MIDTNAYSVSGQCLNSLYILVSFIPREIIVYITGWAAVGEVSHPDLCSPGFSFWQWDLGDSASSLFFSDAEPMQMDG